MSSGLRLWLAYCGSTYRTVALLTVATRTVALLTVATRTVATRTNCGYTYCGSTNCGYTYCGYTYCGYTNCGSTHYGYTYYEGGRLRLCQEDPRSHLDALRYAPLPQTTCHLLLATYYQGTPDYLLLPTTNYLPRTTHYLLLRYARVSPTTYY